MKKTYFTYLIILISAATLTLSCVRANPHCKKAHKNIKKLHLNNW